MLTSSELPARFAHNVEYFLVGRHFGFVPYFFPGVIAIAWWLLSRARRDTWRLCVFGAVVASAIVTLIVLPWTWSGGGGPPAIAISSPVYPLVSVPAAAGHLRCARRPRLDRRRAVHREDARQSVLGGEISLSGDREGTGAATAGGVDDGQRSAGPVGAAAPRADSVPARSGREAVFSGSERVAAGTDRREPGRLSHSQHVDLRLAAAPTSSSAPRGRSIVCEMEVESPIATVVTLALEPSRSRVTLVPRQVQTFDLKTSGVRGIWRLQLPADRRDRRTGFIPHLMEAGKHGLPQSRRADSVPAGHCFRRNIITEVKTVSSRRTVMCGDRYGLSARSTGSDSYRR